MPKVIARLLPLLLLFHFHPGSVEAQQLDRPPSLSSGDAVVTGFSGAIAPDPTKLLPANRSVVDLTFINPDGPSARIMGVRQATANWDGRVLPATKPYDVLARDVGQVFGIALDDQTAPNIYLSATSAFGLQLVARGPDGQPSRVKQGGPAEGWMRGQFGLELQGGPGSIFKVDGKTGVVSLFANVALDGVPNPAPALGSLAFDAQHQQLFVSDLYTGMIHRFDLNGNDLGHFDHGVTGRTAAKLAPVPFDPRARPNIAVASFDTQNPASWGYAPAGRRVWGLALHEQRLFYAVADGPQIWSVGIQQDGGFANDPRWELDVPAQPGPYQVSDILFSQKGAMILAQRAPIAASYDYSAFTAQAEPRVLRYWLENPRKPGNLSRWIAEPEEYAVGFAGDYRNTNGGVALGYGYGPDGALDAKSCEVALWTTGQDLRNDPALQTQLLPGGPLVVHGVQLLPAAPVRPFNQPPWTSYSVDYDSAFHDPAATGHLGQVRILTVPCADGQYGGPGYAVSAAAGGASTGGGGVGPGGGGVGPGGGGVGPGNCPNGTNPDGSCTTAYDLAIVKTGVASTTVAGGFTFNLAVTNPGAAISNAAAIDVTDVVPAGMTFTGVTGGASWSCTPVAPIAAGGTLTCAYVGAGPIASGAALPPIAITATAPQAGSFNNCATVGFTAASGLQDSNSSNNTSCATVTNPIDLGIVKTGEAMPSGPDATSLTYAYTLTVTNVGMAFNGQNVVTVTDVVPAGMTFTAATGANWTCATLPVLAGGTLTCTYTGSGSIATGAVLGAITITATGGGGTVQNCASVGVTAASGLQDSNAANNTSCVTLTNGFIQVNTPPPIAASCGVNVIFVVDESGSIANHPPGSTNSTGAVIAALDAGAQMFNINGAQGAAVFFNDYATIVKNWSTNTLQPGVASSGYAPTGQTNWQDAMTKALSLVNSAPANVPPNTHPIIFFITDGDPDAYGPAPGTPTTDETDATNKAITVVNQIYALGVPIIGIGVGVVDPTHLNALLGGNTIFPGGSYSGLQGALQGQISQLCPGLMLTKSMSPDGYALVYNTWPQNPPFTDKITLTVTNFTGGQVNNVIVNDALPALPVPLTGPSGYVTSSTGTGSAPGTAGPAAPPPGATSLVVWQGINLAPNGGSATLSFNANVTPTAQPSANQWTCTHNFAQVTSVNGVAESANGSPPSALMANPVTGPVHEPDEATDDVCVIYYTGGGGQPCTDTNLWVTKTILNNPEAICIAGGTCTFQITVTPDCKAFSGPVVFGDGFFLGSNPASPPPTITSISTTSNPSSVFNGIPCPSAWSSTSTPTSCSANVNLSPGQSITFDVTVSFPSTTPPGQYKNCFVADGMTPQPNPPNFSTAYAQVNPPTSPSGYYWGDCVPFGVAAAAGLARPPVDVAIAKTGVASADGNGYAFHLTVTNVGAAFNGANAITVTDVVPAGMTFNTASGPNWTCATLPVAAGGTLTCRFTGPGPTAPNQALGTIDINATAAGAASFPSVTNCATVGLTPSSGLQDTNPANNRACVTVVKQRVCPQGTQLEGNECVPLLKQCLPPMVPNAAGTACGCPQGTVQRGRECVRPIDCRPPMVPNVAGTACGCPQGTVQKGQECVRPLDCRPPLVPNAAGTACGCPQGTVLKGQECVRPLVCRAPLVPNAAGTACGCPQGTVLKGQECVRPLVCRAPLVPNAAGTACGCPQGTVLKGQECVRPLVCRAPLVPNAAGTACGCPQGTVLRGRECVPTGPVGRPGRGQAQPGGGRP